MMYIVVWRSEKELVAGDVFCPLEEGGLGCVWKKETKVA